MVSNYNKESIYVRSDQSQFGEDGCSLVHNIDNPFVYYEEEKGDDWNKSQSVEYIEF